MMRQPGESPSTDNEPEIVEIVLPSLPPGALWRPSVGEETMALLSSLSSLDDASRERVSLEASDVLARCVPPHENGQRTGLAIGYVQSGKTMSFTTVATLAHDNGFPLVILVAGTSMPLSSQSRDRVVRDLRLTTRSDRKWLHLHNPRNQQRQQIENVLADWRDPNVPTNQRKTVLITVMKNHRHLDALRALLGSLSMDTVPALLIDDEGDQASLNTLVRRGDESTTYRLLLDVRATLPKHTFLQYTATPQAPLLINIIDTLSPDFAHVLTPGDNYVGGRDFFVERPELVRTIPLTDTFPPGNPPTDTPDSLLEAMRLFFLGVAAALVQDRTEGNRSMMVHPSQRTLPHHWYYHRVRDAKNLWLSTLELSPRDPDRQQLVQDFEPAYLNLSTTVADLPPFDALIGQMARALRSTPVQEINARQGPTEQVNWRDLYSWILVGGQAMDRGFTVEGLTVTYMPRGAGVGNADTIQQRARFFGYKRSYLGYCRVFLESEVRDAYRVYVEHEENVRDQMQEWEQSGRPLSEWRRAFFLNSALRPTRKNVLGLDYIQSSFSHEWVTPNVPHTLEEVTQQNREAVQSFLDSLVLLPQEGDSRRTDTQRHQVAENVLLQAAYEGLLTRFHLVEPTDSQQWTGLCLQVANYLEGNPSATCRIVYMSGGAARERGVDDNDMKVKQLFQGAYPVQPVNQRGSIYPGDREIYDREGITIQIHTLRLARDGVTLVENVPTLAFFAAPSLGADWLIQQAPGGSPSASVPFAANVP